eukprot:TRINITY_DN5838_c0_g2_i1.p1 TRINITY_DN5838_c0_g2~~TRINITY_DN5838_c0_g2_i1.p1  ORF type:complete len:243 (+),score=52.66 TRINITY_DN5838_c0_g2_i1:49-777(+)
MRGKLGTPGSEGSSMDRDSLDDFSAEEMLVLATDNLQLDQMQEEEEEETPPKSLIVTNVDISVFIDEQAKLEFESKFRAYDQSVTFYYFRTFRRVRVDFMSNTNASLAKSACDLARIGESTINCYFIRVFAPDPEEEFLQPPPMEKQFLISPPCSPPVGWEQPREGNPVVDYELLAAMAQLAPGKDHMLHPSTSVRICGNDVSTPSIIVNVCGESEQSDINRPPNMKIVQTRCPVRKNSIED